MIRTTIAAAALLLAVPVQAQSFFPNLTGHKFCQLRSVGVSFNEAVDAAVRSNWSDFRSAIYVTRNGERVTTDVIAFAHYVANNCPQYGQR